MNAWGPQSEWYNLPGLVFLMLPLRASKKGLTPFIIEVLEEYIKGYHKRILGSSQDWVLPIERGFFWVCYLLLNLPAVLTVWTNARIHNLLIYQTCFKLVLTSWTEAHMVVCGILKKNGTTCVASFQVLMKWTIFSVYFDEVCQTLTRCFAESFCAVDRLTFKWWAPPYLSGQ